MPKKLRPRAQVVRRVSPTTPPTAKSPRRRVQLVLGGVILAVALGVGVWVRSGTDTPPSTPAPVAGDKHYTRGPAGAPVVIKEFSDYT